MYNFYSFLTNFFPFHDPNLDYTLSPYIDLETFAWFYFLFTQFNHIYDSILRSILPPYLNIEKFHPIHDSFLRSTVFLTPYLNMEKIVWFYYPLTKYPTLLWLHPQIYSIFLTPSFNMEKFIWLHSPLKKFHRFYDSILRSILSQYINLEKSPPPAGFFLSSPLILVVVPRQWQTRALRTLLYVGKWPPATLLYMHEKHNQIPSQTIA